MVNGPVKNPFHKNASKNARKVEKAAGFLEIKMKWGQMK